MHPEFAGAGGGPGDGTAVRRSTAAGSPEEEPLAPLAPIAPPEEKSGMGRTYTGIVAAAVTTVLAFVVAGQVTDGKNERNGAADGGAAAGQRPGQAAGAAADGTKDRAVAQPSGPAEDGPQGYADKMAQRFALPDDFKGEGKFSAVAGHEKGPRGGEVLRYRVDVEKKLPLDGELFAEAVHKTLNDKRSWAHGGERSFERVSSGKADFVITLASPKTTDVWCAKSGLDTSQEKVSCDSSATDRVMINAFRWARGAKTYGSDRMHQYRQMLINHEVGHRLGHGHVGCEKDGALAPVMMQQTKYLTTDGETCRPNAWPHPRP